MLFVVVTCFSSQKLYFRIMHPDISWKTSYETVTFENYHSKNRIKIDVFIYGCSHGSSLCGVIFIKVVKTLVKTVSELKGVFRCFH